eukprot:TRINITY_DN33536_c0_g1_i2.p1 TRINITY_DN33536_c0_g1~~TRINITY_DN33536_c0_g1_i2.p1  ORF type:complete len:172 (+),score=28.75 TRINITY_DN33536_c0_g1_i2:116-631(+)
MSSRTPTFDYVFGKDIDADEFETKATIVVHVAVFAAATGYFVTGAMTFLQSEHDASVAAIFLFAAVASIAFSLGAHGTSLLSEDTDRAKVGIIQVFYALLFLSLAGLGVSLLGCRATHWKWLLWYVFTVYSVFHFLRSEVGPVCCSYYAIEEAGEDSNDEYVKGTDDEGDS